MSRGLGDVYKRQPENPAGALYGGHPNGKGGKAVCEAFMKQFAELLGK